MRVAYETMLAEFERVLKKYGFSADRAHNAAEIFAQNSLAGVFSHGLNRFPVAVDYLKKGEIDPAAIEKTRRMIPIGYWKGSGLSILLDMIATVLTNANSVAKIGTFGDEIGLTQIMIAIDPTKFQSAAETDAIVDAIAADVASNQPETHAEYIALADFGEKFAAATNGRYQVEIYPNAVLGDQGPMTEMIRTGALQLAVVPMSVPESYNSDFAIIAAPYLYDNLEQMETAAREGVFGPLFATTDKFNFEVATLYTSGARHIYTDKPITKPEDLKGYKIRVQDSDTYMPSLRQVSSSAAPSRLRLPMASTAQSQGYSTVLPSFSPRTAPSRISVTFTSVTGVIPWA